jgi:hypothetical protein
MAVLVRSKSTRRVIARLQEEETVATVIGDHTAMLAEPKWFHSSIRPKDQSIFFAGSRKLKDIAPTSDDCKPPIVSWD